MKEKMISFLKSIGIEDYESFDLDFEMVGRNRFKKEQIDMVILKEKPWEYSLLRRFQDGLDRITNYPYTIRFSYLSKPTVDKYSSLKVPVVYLFNMLVFPTDESPIINS